VVTPTAVLCCQRATAGDGGRGARVGPRGAGVGERVAPAEPVRDADMKASGAQCREGGGGGAARVCPSPWDVYFFSLCIAVGGQRGDDFH